MIQSGENSPSLFEELIRFTSLSGLVLENVPVRQNNQTQV